jgi:hypothetical protein
MEVEMKGPTRERQVLKENKNVTNLFSCGTCRVRIDWSNLVTELQSTQPRLLLAQI